MPHTLHLGPLRSESLVLLQAEAPESLLLITPEEPNQQTTSLLPKAEVRTTLLSPDGESITWHRYNLPEFNSQSLATGLKELYPGLRLQGTESRETEPLRALIDELKASDDGSPKRLILEQPEQALTLLQALHDAGALAHLVQLDIRSAAQPLYEAMVGQAQLIDWCEQQAGLELQGQQAEDPEFPLLHFKRNPLFQQLQDIRQELKRTRKQMTERLRIEQDRAARLANERDALADERDRLKEHCDEQAKAKEAARAECAKLKEDHDMLQQQCDKQAKAKEAARVECAKLKEQRDTLQQQRDEEARAREATEAEYSVQKQVLDELKEQCRAAEKAREVVQSQKSEIEKAYEKLKYEQYQEHQASQLKIQNSLKTLEDRMEYLFGQNTLQLEQAANALGQHVSQTAEYAARELEAGIALQQFARDTSAIGTSGLSHSAARELANQLKTNNYDLIIEMGSGSTAQFIAQALSNAGQERSVPNGNQKPLTHYVEASENDLPKRILSFDHNRNRQKEMGEKLTNAGLASYVNFQFTPLVPSHYNRKEQLFYDCGTRLQQVAHLFDDRQARILVVVNIETSETGPEASAALPAVLQHLSSHQLDIIIHTPAQQQLADQWVNLLKERGLDHTVPKALGTGQVHYLTVNP